MRTYNEHVLTNKPKDEQPQGWIYFLDEHRQMTRAVGIIAPIECYITGTDIFN